MSEVDPLFIVLDLALNHSGYPHAPSGVTRGHLNHPLPSAQLTENILQFFQRPACMTAIGSPNLYPLRDEVSRMDARLVEQE